MYRRALPVVCCVFAFLIFTNAAFACTATQDRTVVICSPPANGTVASPVQLSAAALDNEYRITAMAAYANGVEVAHSGSGTLNASVALRPGSGHLLAPCFASLSYVFARPLKAP